jgi:hypothetical protein
MGEITLKSGQVAVINCCSFDEALTLKDAIEKEFAINLDKGMLRSVLMVDSSESFKAALWPCLARCLYKGEKITRVLFNAKETRQDYYEIVRLCVEENLGPLESGLRSLLLAFELIAKTETKSEGQKSESTTKDGLQPQG